MFWREYTSCIITLMENFSRKVGSFVHVDVRAYCIIQGLLSPIKGILMQFLKSSLPPQGMDNMGLGKKKYKRVCCLWWWAECIWSKNSYFAVVNTYGYWLSWNGKSCAKILPIWRCRLTKRSSITPRYFQGKWRTFCALP